MHHGFKLIFLQEVNRFELKANSLESFYINEKNDNSFEIGGIYVRPVMLGLSLDH